VIRLRILIKFAILCIYLPVDIIRCSSSLLYAERLLRLGLWTRRQKKSMWFNRMFKMSYGYTEIDVKIRVLFTLDGNDKGLRGRSKNICKPRFNTDIRKYFFSNRVIDRSNSLDQTLLLHPAWTVSEIDWIKLDAQGWVSSWTSPLNPRPCHVGWPQDKAALGKHKLKSKQWH